MEVKHKDLEEGVVEVRVTSLDDLWTLKGLIEAGDRVRARTHRRESSRDDLTRSKRAERRPVTLVLEVESVEFHRHTERLRLLGVILEGDEDSLGMHHTINVDVGKELSIEKDAWREDQLERLDEAGVEGPNVGILTIEEGDAFYGLVRQFGVDKTFAMSRGSGKLYGESSREGFFGEVGERLNRAFSSHELDAVVVAGPGFTKEDFADFVEERYPDLEGAIHLETCSGAGPGGVQEVIRRGAVERIGRETRLSRDSSAVEDLLETVARDGPATYGSEAVERALELGAVERLLVTDEVLRREDLGEMLRKVENSGGNYAILSSEFEPGSKLDSLGGVAALLRFPIE